MVLEGCGETIGQDAEESVALLHRVLARAGDRIQIPLEQ